MPVGLLAAAEIALLALVGVVVRQWWYGSVGAVYLLLSLFLSTNLLICYWEICLFLRRDYIERRSIHWREIKNTAARHPAVEFLSTKISLRHTFSSAVWADVWAAYSSCDGSFSDRRTFGFNADVCNGFFTPIPSLILYATLTVNFLPAVWAGILGVMLFWQWTYVTSAYWVSFFMANRHKQIGKGELYALIWGTNCPWVLCSLVGLYASIRMIVDGNYSVVGG
jgi:hypothetical protein